MRQECIVLVEAAVEQGCRFKRACEVLGISLRTFQRWKSGSQGDQRKGPTTPPANKLGEKEREKVLEIATSKAYRDLSPAQIVPHLADQGTYVACESTFYRLLREASMLRHRSAWDPTSHHKPKAITAMKPNQVWSWDITYLLSLIQRQFYYLYLVEDIFSRKIVGWDVFEGESSVHASDLIEGACQLEGISQGQLTIHSDNGSPMKGATLLATMERLGVARSFSRPGVSDDNPYSESLFRTLKYRPAFPKKPFKSLEEAREWVACFVKWYNHVHLHSGIKFVTPGDRHQQKDGEILKKRREVYEIARKKNPIRWSRETRNWNIIERVNLNPEKEEAKAVMEMAA